MRIEDATEHEARVARRRAYALLSTLLLEGIDAERLALVRALPRLHESLPAAELGLDELAAEHQRLLGHELFPFAGAFTSRDGLVGAGKAAEVLRSAHAALGLPCDDEPSPDHLGQGLRLLGIMVEAELEARAHGDEADVRTLVRWQRRVLDEALLPWMPPLLAALSGQPGSLWTRALELAVGVLARHRAELGGLVLLDDEGTDDEPEAVLDDPHTGLRTVAAVLVTPARSGVFLARRDLDAVARRCALPGGFGARKDVLERLLRVAAEYQQLPRVLDELQRLLDARDDTYAGLEREPGLAAHVPAWRRRLAGSRRMLSRLRDAAEATPPAMVR